VKSYNIVSRRILKTSENLQQWGLYHIPGEIVAVTCWCHCKKISFLYQDETSLSATCTHCPLSSPCGSLWRESLCPLCSCPL